MASAPVLRNHPIESFAISQPGFFGYHSPKVDLLRPPDPFRDRFKEVLLEVHSPFSPTLTKLIMAAKGRPTILLALVTCLLGQFPPFSGVGFAAADLGVIPNRYIVETSSQNILQHLGERGGLVS